MKKIKAEYIDHMGTDLSVVNAARVSYGKRKDVLDAGDEKLLDYLAKHSHHTPFEHTTLTVKIDCPLYIRSQIMRHRTFSYNEISRRYTDKDIDFYVPTSFRKQHQSSKQCSDGDLNALDNMQARTAMKNVIDQAIKSYNEMIAKGCSKELARGVLPQCMMTEFYMTGNLRNYLHFLKLRLDKHSQIEVISIAEDVKKIIEDKFPKSSEALFKYI